MKRILKAKYLLSFFLLLVYFVPAAQPDNASQRDDDFTAFLLLFATFFACMAIGAAVIGAMAAALFCLLLFALIGFGLLSTSVAVGLYKRSVPAGFKTLLCIVFGSGCAVCGTGLALFVHHFLPLRFSLQSALITGFVAGALGGSIMGLSAFTVVQSLLRSVYRRLGSAR